MKKYKRFIPIVMIIIILTLILLYLKFYNWEKESNGNVENPKDYGVIWPKQMIYLNNSAVNITVGPVVDNFRNPIQNAKVQLFLFDYTFTNYTDDNGYAILRINISVPRNDYRCIIEKEGYPIFECYVDLEIREK